MRLRLSTILIALSATLGAFASDDGRAALSVDVNIGMATPLKGGSTRPTLSVGALIRPVSYLGLGVEAMWGINTSRWPRMVHSSTAFDNSYIGAYGQLDILSLAARSSSPWSLGIEAGAGWGHDYRSGLVADHNYFATRAGLFAGYELSRSFAIVLRPSFIWNMSDANVAGSSAAYSASRCAFMLQAGLRYNFGRRLVSCRPYDAAAVVGLNSEINTLRARVDSLSTELDKRPAVIREEAVDNAGGTVYDIFFRAGSASVEPDQMPNIERIAVRLKQNATSDVLIQGYASPDGSTDSNLQLARQRANSIARLLKDRYKIAPARIRAVGEGVGNIFSEESWNRVAVCTIRSN